MYLLAEILGAAIAAAFAVGHFGHGTANSDQGVIVHSDRPLLCIQGLPVCMLVTCVSSSSITLLEDRRLFSCNTSFSEQSCAVHP